LGILNLQQKTNQLSLWLSFVMIWIVIGLSIHFEKWILILIVNHIFLMDLDWIKKIIEQQPVYMGNQIVHYSENQTIKG